MAMRYVDDEDVEDIKKAFAEGEKGVTAKPYAPRVGDRVKATQVIEGSVTEINMWGDIFINGRVLQHHDRGWSFELISPAVEPGTIMVDNRYARMYVAVHYEGAATQWVDPKTGTHYNMDELILDSNCAVIPPPKATA